MCGMTRLRASFSAPQKSSRCDCRISLDLKLRNRDNGQWKFDEGLLSTTCNWVRSRLESVGGPSPKRCSRAETNESVSEEWFVPVDDTPHD